MEIRKNRRKDTRAIWVIALGVLAINLAFPGRWYLGSEVVGFMILMALVMQFSLNSGKPVLKIEDGDIQIANWLSGRLESIGSVSDYHLVIQKDDLFFRKDNEQDKIFGRPVSEEDWVKYCEELQQMPFNGFTITYNKAKQAGTH